MFSEPFTIVVLLEDAVLEAESPTPQPAKDKTRAIMQTIAQALNVFMLLFLLFNTVSIITPYWISAKVEP